MSTIDSKRIKAIADILYSASSNLTSIDPLSVTFHPLTLSEAYAVQMYNVERGLQQGRVISGKKVGLTNLAMQELLGVDQPDYGHLFSDMLVTNGIIELKNMLQPRAEAEIAFVLSKSLDMDRPLTVEDVLDATEYVLPSLEIVDSRVKDWKIGITDTVADNASCGLYVLGTTKTRIEGFDRLNEEMNLFINDHLIGSGNGRAVLGDSAYCVAWLGNKLKELGSGLKKGDIILPGALSKMVPVVQGDVVRAEFSTIGEVEVKFI